MSDWTEDVEFGRQRLTGTNPGAITLCQELPIKYVVLLEGKKKICIYKYIYKERTALQNSIILVH